MGNSKKFEDTCEPCAPGVVAEIGGREHESGVFSAGRGAGEQILPADRAGVGVASCVHQYGTATGMYRHSQNSDFACWHRYCLPSINHRAWHVVSTQ